MNFLTLSYFLAIFYFTCCAIMSDNCLSYSDFLNQNCTKCRPGYTLASGACIICTGECLTTSPEQQNFQANLQNCKQIDRSGKCILCFNGYNIDISSNCVKVDDSTLRQNCLVYMQKNRECILCEDGFAKQNNNGPCKVVKIQIGSNGVIGISVKANNTLAQAEKISTLVSNLIQENNISKNSSVVLQNNTNKELQLKPIDKTKGKIVLFTEANNITKIKLDYCDQYETKNNQKVCARCVRGYLLNTLSKACTLLSSPIALTSAKRNSDALGNSFVKSDSNVNKIIESKPQANTSETNKSGNSSNQVSTNQNSTQVKTTNNYTQQKQPLSAQNVSNLSQTFDIKTDLKTDTTSQVPNLPQLLTQRNNEPKTENTSDSKAIRNISAEASNSSNVDQPQTNIPGSNLNNTSSVSINSTSSIFQSNSTNTVWMPGFNITNNTSTSIVSTNISVNVSNPTSQYAKDNNTSSPQSSSSSSSSQTLSNVANITSLPNASKTSNYSIDSGYATIVVSSNVKNITNDEKPAEFIKIALTSTQSPNPISFCVRYRVINNQCIQCENKYSLYQNKCLNAFEYRQVMRSSGSVYNVPINPQNKTNSQ